VFADVAGEDCGAGVAMVWVAIITAWTLLSSKSAEAAKGNEQENKDQGMNNSEQPTL
jgi:hypothetical protein